MRRSTEVLAVILTASFFIASPSFAGAPGRVETVLAPAWLERNGKEGPLTPGTEIRNGDIVKTGSGSRAYLMLAEGSRVKLGEAARFEFHDSSLEPQGLFRGVFNVAAGAFRFTTGLLLKSREREVTIQIATATIGIRGTDVWGRATPDSELVALIEGKIELSRAGQSFLMEPMSLMDARRGEAGQLKRFDFATLQLLAAETEISSGRALRENGTWMLVHDGLTGQVQAIGLYDRLRAAGYPAQIRPVRTNIAGVGEWLYSVFIDRFATGEDATQTAIVLQKASGALFKPRKRGKS